MRLRVVSNVPTARFAVAYFVGTKKPTQQKDLDLVFIIEINKLEYSFKFSRFQFRRGNE